MSIEIWSKRDFYDRYSDALPIYYAMETHGTRTCAAYGRVE